MGKQFTRASAGDSAHRIDHTKKNSKKGLFPKKASLIVYIIVLITAVIARTIQLSTNFDYAKGRYINDSLLTNFPLLIIIAGIAVMAFFMLAGSAKDKVIDSCILINPMRLRYDRVSKKIPHIAGYCGVFMALLILFQIIFDIASLIMANNMVKAELTEDEAADYSVFTGYTVGDGICHVLMFFTMLAFISMAVNIFKDQGMNPANCASFSFFAFWKLAEILNMIMENSVISTDTHMVYVLLSDMAASIFFLTTARFFNGMEKKFTRFWMCMFGYVSSILAAVSVIPRYILLLMPADYDIRVEMSIPQISDIGMAFMPITIVAVFWSTYVYRVMPKLNLGKRRWSKAPISKEFQKMDSIEIGKAD